MKKIVFIACSLDLGFSVKGQPVNDSGLAKIGPPSASLQLETVQPVSSGDVTFLPGNHSVLAGSKKPNEAMDGNAGNDSNTNWRTNSAALTGAYTINKNAAASATNFISFTA